MAAILKHDGDHIVFRHGKHKGETLDDVANEDPGYLKWVFNEAADELPDDLFSALETCLSEHDIEP